MKRTFCWLALFLLVSGCGFLRGQMGAEHDIDHNVLSGGPVTGTRIKDLPDAVKQTLEQRVPTAQIADIDKELKGDRVVYKISFLEAGDYPTMYITQDGSVIQPTAKPNGVK